ncbi:MAG: hypothetical protein U9P88_00735 [Patescibacteria group bacterium]|nr:hypothetical protein [Patescibacteria group bacterium]
MAYRQLFTSIISQELDIDDEENDGGIEQDEYSATENEEIENEESFGEENF